MSSAPSSAEADPLDRALTAATARIVAAVAATGRAAPTVLVDGPSGAGKTSLAERLRRAWPLSAGVTVLALDSLYPGWSGLAAGAEIVLRDVLEPRAAEQTASWPRWDWETSTTAERHDVPADVGLVVEGSGVLTAASALLADVTVWVDAAPAERHRRAMARDGDAYRPYWEHWAVQEAEHLRANAPADRAGIRIDLP